MLKRLAILLPCVVLAGCGKMHSLFGHWSSGPVVRGSGVVKTITRPPLAFSKIVAMGSMDVTVPVGKPGPITIEGDDNIVALVKTELSGDQLTIRLDGSYSTTAPIRIICPTTSLDEGTVNGSGDLHASGVSGKKADFTVNGSGNIVAQGTVSALNAAINGSGELHLFNLHSASSAINIAGSGRAEVDTQKALQGSVSGSGEVIYKGKPTIAQTVNGSGQVRPAQ